MEGRLTPDLATGGPKTYTRKDGTSGASYDVSANTVRFLSSRSDTDGGGAAAGGGSAVSAGVSDCSDRVPSLAGGLQRVEIQVPQIVSWRLHERFRWPTNQVLLLSCGVVATPPSEHGRIDNGSVVRKITCAP